METRKSTIYISACLLLIGFLMGLLSCSQTPADNSILRAVPSDAGIVIKTQNLSELCNILDNENLIWKSIANISNMKSASSIVYDIDTTLKNNSELRQALHGKDIAISFHTEGKDKIRTICAISANDKEADRIVKCIASATKSKGYDIAGYNYDKTKIFVVTNKKNKNGKTSDVFAFAYTEKLLVCSVSRIMTEKAIRHIHSHNTITSDKYLRQLLNTEGKNVPAILIVNYPRLYTMMRDDLNPQMAKHTEKIERQAEWSVLDISLEKQTITCAGFSSSKGANSYIDAIKSQQPVENTFAKYLPSKTTSFVSLGISNMQDFKNQHTNLLKNKDQYQNYKKTADAFRINYNIDIEDFIYLSITKRITEFSCSYSLAGRPNDHYTIAELDDDSKFEKTIANICNQYRKQKGIADNNGVFSVKTASGKKHTVYLLPQKNLIQIFFGDIFSNETGYITISNDKAIFGSSVESLREYLNCIENRKILAANSNYDEFTKHTTSKSNLFYYADIEYSQNEIKSYLSRSNAQNLENNSAQIKNLRSVALQFSYQDDMCYTNAAIMYNQIIEADRYVAWIAPADTSIIQKPYVVTNHTNGDKEIIATDETNKLYLFDKLGKQLWKKQMPEPITSPIFQIDAFNNGKLQYLFATENYLHAIDRNGNYLENYPVKLPAKVSTEISIFDYDGTHNYRIFVPCSNKTLYVYTKDGINLDTWTPLHTHETIATPVQYFHIGDNEYLVCADNLKTYILNRRGEVRINVTNDFPKAKNTLYYLENANNPANARFITTNSSGEIKYIYTDGSCQSLKFKNYSANHHFSLFDIDGDGTNEYIFTDKDILDVFKQDGTIMFSYCFDGSVGKPSIFKFSAKDIRIGVTCKSEQKIYLFNNNGKICNGFPLQGISEFSISKISNNDKFSILSGNSDNYLYNYLIQ